MLPISLREVTSLAQSWSRVPTEFQGPSEKQLENLCNAMTLVLPGCEGWLNEFSAKEGALLTPAHLESLNELGQELGLDEKMVARKIEEVWRGLRHGNNQDK